MAFDYIDSLKSITDYSRYFAAMQPYAYNQPPYGYGGFTPAINFGKKQKNKKGTKGTPSPQLFPSAIFAVIRGIATSKVLSSDQSNPMNAYSAPITMGDQQEFFCYSADLLKLFFKYLSITRPWSDTALISYQKKETKGYSQFKVEAQKKVACINLPDPTPEGLAMSMGQVTKEQCDIINEVNNVIMAYFLPKNIQYNENVPRLCTPIEWTMSRPRQLPVQGEITTPGSMAKKERLNYLGYRDFALGTNDQKSYWAEFHSMETKRLKFLIDSQNGGFGIDSKHLQNLTPEQAEIYNNCLPSAMQVDTSANLSLAALDKYSQNQMNSSSISQSLGKIYISVQNVAKPAKPAVSKRDQYLDAIEVYKMFTGYQLDINAEMSNNTLSYRTDNINWMHNLRLNDPYVAFRHDVNFNRPMTIQTAPTSAPVARNAVNVPTNNAQMSVQTNQAPYYQPPMQQSYSAPNMYSSPGQSTVAAQVPQRAPMGIRSVFDPVNSPVHMKSNIAPHTNQNPIFVPPQGINYSPMVNLLAPPNNANMERSKPLMPANNNINTDLDVPDVDDSEDSATEEKKIADHNRDIDVAPEDDVADL